ncbi:PA14 domain-containing protein [Streptomyces sp. NPDC098789]|uniref:PA14 domain-containing protein n=1 Tax=Streptomyces sp. NPDC098789 TaxID=3366098 RepID=UPI00382AD834
MGMAPPGKLRALTTTTAVAALLLTLLGAESPAAAGSGGKTPASRSAFLAAPAGPPVQPAWPSGVFAGGSGPITAGPAAPAPAGPADGETLTDSVPRLAAEQQTGAAAYEFVLSTGATARTGLVTSSGWIDAPQWQVPAGLLKDGGQYKWTVRTKDRSGRSGADAPARSFSLNQRLGAQAPGSPVPTDVLGPVTVALPTGNAAVSVKTPQVYTGSGVLGATFQYDSQAVATSAGLTGSYYPGDADSGIAADEKAAFVRTDARIGFRWGAEAAYPGGAPDAPFRARWTGRLQVPADGVYRLGGSYDGGVRILVDGRPVLDEWRGAHPAGAREVYGRGVTLQAGHGYDITVEYRRGASGGEAGLWISRAGRAVPVPASWLQPAGAVLPPGWSVTPGAAGPDAANAADPADGTAARGAAPVPSGPPARAAAPAGAGAPARGARKAPEPAGGGDAARAGIKSAEDTGLRFFYAGSTECADGGAPAGHVCAVRVPSAGTTQLVYRGGKLVRFVNPGEETTDFGFTADHRLTAVRPPLVMDWIAAGRGRDTGAAQYQIAYREGSASVAEVTAPDPAGTAGHPERRPQHAYAVSPGSAQVRTAGVSTAQGWTRKVTFDPAGRLLTDTDATLRTTRSTWTATEGPASTTDAAGRMSTTVYGENGMPSGSYGPGPRECFGADLRPLSPAPDACAKVAATTTSYGPTGSRTVRADSDGVPQQVVETRLNAFGLPVATVADPDGLALSTGYEFDDAFRLTAQAAPGGGKKTTAYYGATEDADNPCTAANDPAPQRGLPKSVSLPDPATGSARVEKLVFSARGLPIAVTNGATDWTCVTYDARGRMSGTFVPADANAPARTVTFDLAVGGDPLASRATDSLGAVSFTTDLLGRTTRFTDVHGTRTDTEYDRAGRPVRERVTPPTPFDAPQVKTLRYDAAGRVQAVSLDGATLASVRHDAGGDVAAVDYANGTRLAVERDPQGRTIAKNWILADGRTLASKVTRSRSGTIVDESTAGEDPRPDGPNYRYDAVGRLTDAYVTGHHYGYDFTSPASADCPTGTTANAGANGNRVALVDRTASGTSTTHYCYDGSDRLLASTGAQVIGRTRYSVAGALTRYDLGGTPMGQVFDAAERYLGKSAAGPDPAVIAYPGDLLDLHAGRTIAQGPAAGTLLYGYTSAADPQLDLVMDGDKRLLTRTVALPGGVVYVAKGRSYRGETSWNLPTVRGDIFLVAGADGRQRGDLYRYGPFGEALLADGRVDSDHVPDNLPGENDYAWLGQYEVRYEHAGSNAAYFLRTRVLEPATGRFSGPVTHGPFANSYDYGSGDPINRVSVDGVGLKEEDK